MLGPIFFRPHSMIQSPVDCVEVGPRHVALQSRVPALHVTARVALDSRTTAEDLHRGLGSQKVELLANQGDMDAVEVVIKPDVVVETDPRSGPLNVLVGPGRQRLERTPLDFLEELTTGLSSASASPGC